MAAVVLTPRSHRPGPRPPAPAGSAPAAALAPWPGAGSARRPATRHGWWFAVLFVATAASLVWALSATRTPASGVGPVGRGEVPAGSGSPAGAAVVTPPAPAAPPAASETYTVRPGDTLWSIAGRIRPGADPRPVVDELARRSGGGAIQPGQQLPVGGLPD